MRQFLSKNKNMNKLMTIIGILLLGGTVFFTSCSNDVITKESFENKHKPSTKGEAYYQTSKIAVPVGCKEVFIEYTDANGKLTTQPVAINPEPVPIENGRDAAPFSSVILNVQAPAKTMVNIYEKSNQQNRKNYLVRALSLSTALNPTDLKYWSPTAYSDYFYAQSGIFNTGYYNPEYFDSRCIDGAAGKIYIAVDKGSQSNSNSNSNSDSDSNSDSGKVVLVKIGGETGVESTKSTDNEITYYHSSGVVMFDDSWPNDPGENHSLSDYNDVVLDYDIEAGIADNESVKGNSALGGKEKITVVMQLRANGGVNPESVGLAFEGLKSNDILNIESHLTLDSWQNPHGELPQGVKQNIKPTFDISGEYPILKINGIHWLNSYEATQEKYNYVNDRGETKTHVFNPRHNPIDKSQFKEGKIHLVELSYSYYNTTPGHINVNGGLITATFEITLKNRANLCCGEAETQGANMMNAVVNTETQNFFITTRKEYAEKGFNNGYEIHCKGYKPTPAFASLYKKANQGSSSTFYAGKAPGNKSWGMKAPVLTRHLWAGNPLILAYPNFIKWLRSNGTEYADWYINGIDEDYLVCWW